jgi:hypothetical protein
MKKLISFIAFIFCFTNNYGQGNWEVIDIPDEFNVTTIQTMFYDELEDALWMGGKIKSVDSLVYLPYNFLLKYDGTIWNYYGPFAGSNFFDICRFQDKIVFCGEFNSYLSIVEGPTQYRGIAYIQADTVGHFDGMGASLVYGLNVIDDELYAFGVFDTICGIAANSVGKFNGSQWNNVNEIPNIGSPITNRVVCGLEYNQDIFLGGSFNDEEYFSSNNSSIVNYNGTNWELTGGGIYGGYTGVSELEVFQDELYAGGIIYKLAGNAGNGIQKWNSTNWSSVGGDLKGYGNDLGSLLFVNDLEVHNDELFIAGVFDYAGEITAGGIVKWDGEKYCSFGSGFYINPDIQQSGLNCLAFMNDTLYVAGGFIYIDSIQTHQGKLAKYIGGNTVFECSTVGIKENDALLQLDIYPSPALTEITFTLPKANLKNTSIEIYNILGQKVITEKTILAEKTIIDIKKLNNGQYFVLAKQNGVVIANGKFVKE